MNNVLQRSRCGYGHVQDAAVFCSHNLAGSDRLWPIGVFTARFDPLGGGSVEQARQAMDAVLSYQYTGEISSVDGEDIQKARIEGEWSSPGASRIRISKAGTGDSNLEEFVSVGGQTLRRIADYAGGA